MKQPMKCECGKMIRRPKGNKTGMCSACSMRKRTRDKLVSHTADNASPCIKSTSLEVKDGQR